MTDERRAQLIEALDTILGSQEVFDEFENANYHSAWGFLEETAMELRRGDDIGYERWAEDEEPA